MRTVGVYISLNPLPVPSMKACVTTHHEKKIPSLQGHKYKCNHNWKKLLSLEVESCLIKMKFCCKAEVIISLAVL